MNYITNAPTKTGALPWRVQAPVNPDHAVCLVYDADESMMATVYGDTSQDAIGNAEQLAAAAELVHVCSQLLEALYRNKRYVAALPDISDAYDSLSESVAKIRGRL